MFDIKCYLFNIKCYLSNISWYLPRFTFPSDLLLLSGRRIWPPPDAFLKHVDVTLRSFFNIFGRKMISFVRASRLVVIFRRRIYSVNILKGSRVARGPSFLLYNERIRRQTNTRDRRDRFTWQNSCPPDIDRRDGQAGPDNGFLARWGQTALYAPRFHASRGCHRRRNLQKLARSA